MCLLNLQALRLVDLYAKKGFDLKSKRIYIKVSVISLSKQFLLFSVHLCLPTMLKIHRIRLRHKAGPRKSSSTAPFRSMTCGPMQIASTWEGIRACEILQKQGIDTNMTLLFSFAQVLSRAKSTGLGHASLEHSNSEHHNSRRIMIGFPSKQDMSPSILTSTNKSFLFSK